MINATIIGNIGQVEELAQVGANNTHCLRFSVASNQRDGSTLWVRCTAWGQTALNLDKNIRRVKSVVVIGALSLNEYNAKDGTPRISLECNVQHVDFTAWRNDADDGNPNDIPF